MRTVKVGYRGTLLRTAFLSVVVLALAVSSPSKAQNSNIDYNLQIDLAMAVLDDDPVLNRILTVQPSYPGPRFAPDAEGIVSLPPEAAQAEFRPPVQRTVCRATIGPKPILICTVVTFPPGS